jgi:ATP-binding cassette subfamily B protein
MSLDACALEQAKFVNRGVFVGCLQRLVKSVFKGVNLHIKPGERIGVVGKTGSGKTTLLQLLTASFRVTSGSVEVDGKNVNSLALKSLWGAISNVPQEPYILDGESIKDNIRCVNAQCTWGVAWQALVAVRRFSNCLKLQQHC